MNLNDLVIRLCEESYVNASNLIENRGDSDQVRGYICIQGRSKILQGNVKKSYKVIKDGIIKLEEAVEREIRNREKREKQIFKLRLDISYSELGEAHQVCGRLARSLDQRVDGFVNSVKCYQRSLEEGKKEEDVIGHLSYSWFKLGQQLSGSGISKETYRSVGSILNLDSELDLGTDLTKMCFEEALAGSEIAREFDSARELRSKIGNVCLELAMMEYDSNNFEKSKDYVLKARKNLLMSMHHDFPFAYVLMARLSDFVKDEIREEDLESLDDIEKVIFRTISRRSWRWVIPEVFKLEEKGKVQFERYDKGTSRISLLVDENFPIRYSFIVKSFHDEAEAKLDFLVTRSINQALKPEIKFTRPLALRYHKTEDGYNYHLVLERVPSRSLDDIFTVMDRDEKLASLNHAVDSLNFFHKSTTRKFSEKGYILEDQVNNETVKHKIEDISYLENFIERVLVGRNKKVIKETIGKLNSGETNDLKCDPKRLGFNEHFLDFYEAHKHFIDFHLSNESFNVVLHGDFYVGNVLDDYTIIDPKELRKGNMMFDLSYFLENVAYHVKDEGLSEDEVIGAVASSLEIVFGENVDLKEVKKQYLCFALHNSVCHASSFCKLGEIDEADFHYNKAIGLMDKLGLTDLKEKYRAYVRETKFNEERVYLRVKNYINKCVQNSDPRNFVEHSCDVEKWVQRMDCNVSVKVKIAALMHDVERAFAVDRKRDVGRSYSDYKEEHAERSTQIVENFLGDLNIKPKFLEDILCLVRCHEVGLSEDHLLYKEMCVLKDADAISFFEESNFDKYLEIWGKEVAVKKIDYSFQRLTERGKSLAKPLYESACKKVA